MEGEADGGSSWDTVGGNSWMESAWEEAWRGVL